MHSTSLQLKVTTLPVDFLLDKKRINADELQVRFAGGGRRIFDKNGYRCKVVNGLEVEVLADLPPTDDQLEDFHSRFGSLRDYTMDLFHPRLTASFLDRLHELFPQLSHIKTPQEFFIWYRKQPNSNELRHIVDIVSHKMCTKQMFMNHESAIMKKLRLEYSTKTSDGNNCKTHRKHGSILSIGVRMFQTYFVHPSRSIGRDTHKEVIYNRCLKRPMKGVLNVMKVTVNSHGYDGYLGRCANHPSLVKEHLANNRAATDLWTTEELSLQQFLEAKAQQGPIMDIMEVLQEWNTTDKRPKEISVSSTSSTSSTASPLTQSVSTNVG